MPTTGPGTAHRHKTKTGYWYDKTDLESGDTHEHTFTETPHPADTLTAEEVWALRGLLVPPTTEPLPPPVTGYVVPAEDGALKKAIAEGHRQLILRGGNHRGNSYGPALRTGDGLVTLAAYEGEQPVIDGTGGPFHYIYIGAGSDWRFTGIDFERFPVNVGDAISEGGQGNGSALIGLQDGHLEMDDCTAQCVPTVLDGLCHGLYAYGIGAGVIRNSRWLDWPGAALHAYRGNPKWITVNSEFTGKRRGALLYSGAHTISGGRLFGSETAFDLEVLVSAASCAVAPDVKGGGPGGSVRRYNA